MTDQKDFVIIRKGGEEHHYHGNTLAQIISGGILNSEIFKEQKKINYIFICILIIVFLIVLFLSPFSQIFRFVCGSVISTILASHLYIVYEKKFLFGGIVVIGSLLSLTTTKLLDIQSFICFLNNFFK